MRIATQKTYMYEIAYDGKRNYCCVLLIEQLEMSLMISKSLILVTTTNFLAFIRRPHSLTFAEIIRIQRLEGGGGEELSCASPSTESATAEEADNSSPPPSSLSGLKYVDVYRERPIRLTVRVLVPVNEHPKVRAGYQ